MSGVAAVDAGELPAVTGSRAAAWQVADVCVLRLSGFGFELLTPLGMTASATAFRAVGMADVKVRQAADALALSSSALALDRGLRRALRRVMQRALPLPPRLAAALPADVSSAYGEAVEHLNECRRIAGDCYRLEQERSRTALRELARDDRFLEAVVLSNPEAYVRISTWDQAGERDTAQSRRVERLVARYAQRFCAKNESASFFGPTTVIELADGDRPAVTGHATGQLRRRSLTFANWAADAMAGVAPVPVRIPSKSSRPLVDLATALRDVSPQTTWSAITELETRMDAFRSAKHERKHGLLGEMDGIFTDITGVSAYRRQATTYGDRMLLREDAEYDLAGAGVSRGLVAEIVDGCSPAFAAMTCLAATHFAGQRRAFAEWLRRAGAPQRLALQDCAALMQADRGALAAILADAHARWVTMTEPVCTRLRAWTESDTGVIVLPDDGAADLVRECEAVGADARWPVLFSPDVLIAAGDQQAIYHGRYQAVLGEIHASIGIDGFYSRSARLAARARTATEEVLRRACAGYQPVQLSTPSDNKTFLTLDLDLPWVDAGGVPPRGAKVISINDIEVVLGEDGPLLEARGWHQPLIIPTRLPNRLHLGPLAFFTIPKCSSGLWTKLLLASRTHLPRIVYKQAVLQRETWVVPVPPLVAPLTAGDDAARFAEALRLHDQLGLPRRTFCKLDGEAKPIYVDWDSWPLVDNLLRRCARGGNHVATISEMTPAPEHLWLHDSLGHHTSELRLCVYRDAAAQCGAIPPLVARS